MTSLIGNLSSSTSSSSFVETLNGNKRKRDEELTAAAEILHPNKKIKVNPTEQDQIKFDKRSGISPEKNITEVFFQSVPTTNNMAFNDDSFIKIPDILIRSFSSSSSFSSATSSLLSSSSISSLSFSSSGSMYDVGKNDYQKLGNLEIERKFLKDLQKENEKLRSKIPLSAEIPKTSTMDIEILKNENAALRQLSLLSFPPIDTSDISISIKEIAFQDQSTLTRNDDSSSDIESDFINLSSSTSATSSSQSNSEQLSIYPKNSSDSVQQKPQTHLLSGTIERDAILNTNSYDDERVFVAPKLMPLPNTTSFFHFLDPSLIPSKANAICVQIPSSVPFEKSVAAENVEPLTDMSKQEIIFDDEIVLEPVLSSSSRAEMRNVIRHNHNIPAKYKQDLQDENEELRKLVPFSEQIVPKGII